MNTSKLKLAAAITAPLALALAACAPEGEEAADTDDTAAVAEPEAAGTIVEVA